MYWVEVPRFSVHYWMEVPGFPVRFFRFGVYVV